MPGPGAGGIVSRHRLFERLASPARVIVVSASAGSGKTVLLRSWIGRADLSDGAAWVAVGRSAGDPQAFWLLVLAALRQTAAGSALVQPLTAAPALDGWAMVERLLTDLAPLAERVLLVVDDVHELGPDALGQLELLIMRAPPRLRFVLATRRDVPLGLHRLRLEGELAEIRELDLRFTVAEARELFDAAGVELADPVPLVQRTEGWAAGLRLAALSLVGHENPVRLAAQFSGTERTVADYLLAEVLGQQEARVRRMLLRTSILDRVNGELAGLLTGDSGGERVLQDLEAANAFVVAMDPSRSWFRYHHLFADLLKQQLRRAEPDEVTELHAAAAGWFAGHGYPVEAVRHAQAARDWPLAARVLTDNWPGLYLDGQAAVIHELLVQFPAEARAADAELAAAAAGDEANKGSLEAAERHLTQAERGMASVPEDRQEQARLLLGMVRLVLARQRGDLATVAEEAQRLQALADTAGATGPGLCEELRALALISLGSAEYWVGKFAEAMQHLERGVALAHRIGRPYLEMTGLAQWAAILSVLKSFTRAVELGTEATELAERHGWSDDPAFGLLGSSLAGMLIWQARLEEAEPWLQRAERALNDEAAQPAASAVRRFARGVFEMMRNRDAEAVVAFQAADLLARRLDAPHYLIPWIQATQLLAMVRLGQTEPSRQYLAGLSDADREHGEVRMAEAALRLDENDPRAATSVLAPVLDGSTPLVFPEWPGWLGQAFLLEAIARDALGDEDAAGRALERALDCAEPDGTVLWFVLHPVRGLLERHAQNGTAHASLIADILSLLAGCQLTPQPSGPEPLLEALSDSELRVLRYLPTNLTAPEIGRELYLSINTIRTHMRHLYEKLGTHTRADTVARGRALGLLAPSPHPAQSTRVA
jgi:LuxR family transcriptional regulator, maltose regulon positive regulatory protein